MVCEFEKLIYPSSASMAEVGSYMVALYRPCEMSMPWIWQPIPMYRKGTGSFY